MKSEVFNEDCMAGMARYPDKFFELAIVDPPYGIGENWKKDRSSPFYKHSSSYKNDTIPREDFFLELFRVSKNQIIWGANYYTGYLNARNSWICWDKERDYPTQHLAEGELAWTSFNIPLRIVKILWNGACRREPRFGSHPHEKPVALYKWLLQNYAKPGDKILDTHLGSGSSRIAAYDMGFDFYGWELDADYFAAMQKRFEAHIAKPALFAPADMYQFEQAKLFETP